MTDRTKTHLKAVIDEFKRMSDELGDGSPEYARVFVSGALTGLSVAYRIADGLSAEDAMEQLVTQLEAAFGRAYLSGAIPTKETDR